MAWSELVTKHFKQYMCTARVGWYYSSDAEVCPQAELRLIEGDFDTLM